MEIKETKHSHDFETLATWSAAFSMGVMSAILASIREINPTVQFRFSVITVFAFFAGAIFTVWFFRTILRHHSRSRRRLSFAVAGAGLVLAYIFFALGSVSPEKRWDVTIGTLLAAGVVSLIAWLSWRIMRFLESEED